MVATAPEVSLGSTLTEEQARDIYAQGEEAVVFALLQFAQQLAVQSASQASTSHDTPATPSGMKPPYAKPTASSRGKKKPGRKKGHLGSRRALQMKVTPGGLVQMWYRLAKILSPWYEQIHQEALNSAVLHADESGWRVNGKTHWLWCFANSVLSYFMIDRSRGRPALLKFFTQEFGGTLVSDFWGAYNAVACALRQTCLVHLLRDLEHVEKYKSPSAEWPTFAKKLRRLLGDAIRLWRKKEELSAQTYASRRGCLLKRLDAMIETPWKDSQARRLIKRLRRHRNDLFTFLDQPGVPFDNNLAERAIRPAVIIRPVFIIQKGSYGNRSDQGADIQAILMSIFFTLKKRGHNPINTIYNALTTYLKTGRLPPMPETVTANG